MLTLFCLVFHFLKRLTNEQLSVTNLLGNGQCAIAKFINAVLECALEYQESGNNSS